MMEPQIPDSAIQPQSQAPRAHEPAPVSPDRAAEFDPELGDVAPLVGRPMTAVQQWLDGEASVEAARRAEPRETALWSQITDETARRSRMVTPAPVLENIIKAIPAAPAPQASEGVLGKMKKLFGK